MSELQGRVALVTGSTSGIGVGIARKLLEAGATVVMHGSSAPEKAEPTRADLAASCGVEVVYLSADVSDPQAVASLVETVKDRFGPVDILVNNAGIGRVGPFGATTRKDWDDTLAVNLTAPFATMQAVLPDMVARGFGRIVNVGSVHSRVGGLYKAAYVASKFGLLGLTKAVALEVAEHGVTCNVVCPGFVRTAMIESYLETEPARLGMPQEKWIRDVLLAEQPNKRLITPEEVGATVVWLCSPLAGSVTGTEIMVDGGWTAH